MGRPVDWHALDLDKDPVPGDPYEVGNLSKTLGDFADDVASALRSIRGLAGDTTLLDWVGLSGDAFRQQYGDLPKDLDKLERSYRMASGALGDYWPQLQHAQSQADKALADAQDARQQLSTANSQLSSADDWVTRANTASQQYQQAPKPQTPPPDPAKVQAAAQDAANAAQARTTAQSAVHAAQDKLDAAKQLAAEAVALRDHAAGTCSHALGEASDAGIHNKSFWQKLADFFVKAWHEIVAICKVVVAVLGVVVMIIGGPLAWVVAAAAVVVLVDTVVQFSQGKASLLDVAFSALGCIPGFKGLTTAGGLFKMAKQAPELLRSGEALGGTARGIRDAGDFVRRDGRDIKSLTTCGDPIDVATGEVIMSATDISLDGVLPLVLERHHRSEYRGGKLFGPSWASTLDQRLLLDDQGVRFTTADGMVLYYPVPEPEREILPVEGPRWPLTWDGTADGTMTVTQPKDGRILRFQPLPHHSPAQLRLAAVSDRNGNHITVSYDAEGNPAEIIHSAGHRVGVEVTDRRIACLRLLSDPGAPVLMRYGYDSSGNLSEISESSGPPTKFTYDKRRITSWEDRNGTWYCYEYDENGRCVRTPGMDRILDYTYAYDEQSRTTHVTDSLGNTSTYQFNDAYRLVRHTDPLGNATVRSWDRYGRLESLTDPLGHTTCYTYDPDGNVVAVREPDGSLTSVEYNDLRLPVCITQPDGTVLRRSYDTGGNCTSVTDPLGAVTAYAYDERGALTSVVDALGTVQYAAVNDAAGRPLQMTYASGATIRMARDAFGRIVQTTDAAGAGTRVTWTAAGRIARRELPDGTAETWSYDAEGNPVEHRTADGRITRYEYNAFDLCSARTDPDGTRYDFTYDTELRLISVTNPNGDRWSYTYDAAGRLITETDFNGAMLSYTYDAAGLLATRTNGAGETLTLIRDILGAVVEQRSADEVTTYAYHASGRLLRTANSHTVIEYEYDSAGRTTRETVNGRSMVYAYDTLGRVIERRTPSGIVSTWTYDTAGRPQAHSSAGHDLHFTYDAVGREIARTLNSGVTLTQTWDRTHRLTAQSVAPTPKAQRPPVQHREYAYDAHGFLSTINELTTGTRRYDHDAAGRITAVHARDWSETYAYDAAGNLTQAATPETDATNQADTSRETTGTLLHRAGQTSFTYDAQGRVIRSATRLLNGQIRTRTFTWNAQDQLVGTVTPDGTRWRYLYDPLGRRIAKQRLDNDDTIAEELRFTWDDSRLAEQTSSDGQTTTWDYLTGTHRPLTQIDQNTQAEVNLRFHAIITDLVGTPTELVSTEGELAWHHRTTLWGAPAPGPTANAVDCPLRFPGQYADPETGWNYNYFRYYDPNTARYTTPDPLGLAPAPNHHAYVDNPLTWTDPLGLTPCEASGVGSAGEKLMDGTSRMRRANARAVKRGGQEELPIGEYQTPFGRVTVAKGWGDAPWIRSNLKQHPGSETIGEKYFETSGEEYKGLVPSLDAHHFKVVTDAMRTGRVEAKDLDTMTADEKRAAAMLYAVGKSEENRYPGAGKALRSALDKQSNTEHEAPEFLKDFPMGMASKDGGGAHYYRDVGDGKKTMTEEAKKNWEDASDSSGDEM
jgi:RHS repeat-associated protein